MANCLYTAEELIQKIKDLDTEMDTAETQSELETGQSDHRFRVSMRTLREQRERYESLLQQCFPDEYRELFGPSAIQFRGNTCR